MLVLWRVYEQLMSHRAPIASPLISGAVGTLVACWRLQFEWSLSCWGGALKIHLWEAFGYLAFVTFCSCFYITMLILRWSLSIWTLRISGANPLRLLRNLGFFWRRSSALFTLAASWQVVITTNTTGVIISPVQTQSIVWSSPTKKAVVVSLPP